jgi:isocitrate dehydrogenase (NAD+)
MDEAASPARRMAHTVTLIPGDGIGPEVTSAARTVAAATGVTIDWVVEDAGERGIAAAGTPLPDRVLESIRRTKVALKGPITTPIGGGFRSVNVALRQQLDLYASVRPARAIAGEGTRFPETDLVVVREATEGLYAGVEHWVDRSTPPRRRSTSSPARRRTGSCGSPSSSRGARADGRSPPSTRRTS